MMTTKDVERAARLIGERDRIRASAKGVLDGETIGVSSRAPASQHNMVRLADRRFDFEHLVAELTALVRQETEAQVAAIDAELRALGVDPKAEAAE